MSTVEMNVSALPKLDSPQIRTMGWSVHSMTYRAYATVLQAETHILKLLSAKDQPTITRKARGDLVCVRAAGQLLLESAAQSDLFGITPSATLVSWFSSPPVNPRNDQNDVIIECGAAIRDKLLRVFRTSNTPYSAPSSHPSRPSFDSLEDMIRDSLEPSGRNFGSSRKKMLARDGYKCVITGYYDKRSRKHCTELQNIPRVPSSTLEAAHILNESTMQGIDPAVGEDDDVKKYNKTYQAAGTLAVLEMFGYSKFVESFRKSGGVHQVWNLLSLQKDVHTEFDNLNLWFEHTDEPHRYKLCLTDDSTELSIRLMSRGDPNDSTPIFVKFNAEHKNAPPPDPLLLALHAMCARVAHLSGAAEFLEQIERDVEDMKVLAMDGSSGPLLADLLSPFTIIPGIA